MRRYNQYITKINHILKEDSISNTEKIDQVYTAYSNIFQTLYNLSLDNVFNSPEHSNIKYAGNRNIIFKYPLSQILIGMEVQKDFIPQPIEQLIQVLDHLAQHDKYYSTLKQTEKHLLNNNLEIASLEQRRIYSNRIYNRIRNMM